MAHRNQGKREQEVFNRHNSSNESEEEQAQMQRQKEIQREFDRLTSKMKKDQKR